MMDFRCFVVCAGRIFQGGEQPEMRSLAMYTYLGKPFTTWFVPVYALYAARVAFRSATVPLILGIRGAAEVGAPVIKGVAVYMVNENSTA